MLRCSERLRQPIWSSIFGRHTNQLPPFASSIGAFMPVSSDVADTVVVCAVDIEEGEAVELVEGWEPPGRGVVSWGPWGFGEFGRDVRVDIIYVGSLKSSIGGVVDRGLRTSCTEFRGGRASG